MAFSGYFPPHRPDSVCSGGGSKLVDIILPTFLINYLCDFFCFCSEKFESVEVICSCLLNLRKAALRWRITVLQSSLNQGMLCLFEAEVFAIVSFAIEMRVSVKCFIWSMILGPFNNFCLHMVSKTCLFALFIFQWGSLSSWKDCKLSSIIGKWSLPQWSLWTFYS